MSGGAFEYKQYLLDDLADEVERIIARNGRKENSDGFEWQRPKYDEEILAKFRETAKTLRLAGKMLQRVDWLVSADDGEDSFKERWKEEVEGNK